MINVNFQWLKDDGEVEVEPARVEVIPRVGDEVLLNFDSFIVERVTHYIDTIDRHDRPILITLGASPEAGDLKRIEKRQDARAAEELAESTLRALSSMDDKLKASHLPPRSFEDGGRFESDIQVTIDPPMTDERLQYLIDKANDDHERDFGW